MFCFLINFPAKKDNGFSSVSHPYPTRGNVGGIALFAAITLIKSRKPQ